MNNARSGTDFSEKSGVDEEWFERYMGSAAYVCSEDIQLIWGKILANEFEKPGSTPPNMIRILSEITPRLANAFRSICSMSISIIQINNNGDIGDSSKRIVVPFSRNDMCFHKMGLGFDVFNELETLGVIKFNSYAGYVNKDVECKSLLLVEGENIAFVKEHNSRDIPIGDVVLTTAGKTLSAITDSIEIDGYFDMVKKYMREKGIVFEDKHNYVVETEGDDIVIKTCG